MKKSKFLYLLTVIYIIGSESYSMFIETIGSSI
ncbi:hypothetical protein ABIA69_001008 [Lysinibacillus parviboronicapiens]|uniref:Uncharacterized protein n=1 Tax=Lysinibacillus parviboronicapiens TaxID=436516 RepID=A0ABV2PG40_9BACI